MNDEVKHRLDLVGMKYIHDMPYFTELPPGFILCTDFKVFFKLKKHKRTVRKDNLEKILGMEFITHSQVTGKYWYRTIWEHSNMRKIYHYFNNQMIFIPADARAPVDEDTILY